jgi:hypothetical protein
MDQSLRREDVLVSESERIAPSFLTSAPDGCKWSALRSCLLYLLGKSHRYALCKRLGGPQPVWTLEKRKILSWGAPEPVWTKCTRRKYKDAVFWDATLCGACKNRRLGGTYLLQNQVTRIGELGTTLAVTRNRRTLRRNNM